MGLFLIIINVRWPVNQGLKNLLVSDLLILGYNRWQKNQRLPMPAHQWTGQFQFEFCLFSKNSLFAKLNVCHLFIHSHEKQLLAQIKSTQQAIRKGSSRLFWHSAVVESLCRCSHKPSYSYHLACGTSVEGRHINHPCRRSLRITCKS